MLYGSDLNEKSELSVNGHFFDFLEEADVTSLTVGSTNVVRSASIILPKSAFFGWAFQFSSGGTINVNIELEQSMDRETWIVPDSKTVPMFTGIADSNEHQAPYAPVATPYARLKLTGVGSNHASTALIRAIMYAVGA